MLLRRSLALLGLLGYLFFAEPMLSNSRLVHVFFIPFGNIWAAAAVFAFCYTCFEKQTGGLGSDGMTRAWRGTLVLVLFAWMFYIALGVFMYVTGGI